MRPAADQSPGEKIWPVPKFLSDSFDPLPHLESDPGIVLECARNRSRRDTRHGSNINNRDFHRGTGSAPRANVRTGMIYWEIESKRGGSARVLCDRLHEYDIFYHDLSMPKLLRNPVCRRRGLGSPKVQRQLGRVSPSSSSQRADSAG